MKEGGLSDTSTTSFTKFIRNRLAKNLSPFSYAYPIRRFVKTVVFNQKEPARQQLDEGIQEGLPGAVERIPRLAAWSKYLNTPIDGVDVNNYIGLSQYKPTQASYPNTTYYTYKPTGDLNKWQAFRINAGEFTIGQGKDNKGTYFSLYDTWDINPFGKGNKGKDMSFGIGRPYEVYDRVYLSDDPDTYSDIQDYYFQLINEQDKKLGDNVLVPYKKGGTIKIKKKNRGKFTDYCGGKVTEECIRKGKNSSNPTTRKRANFAANARKWKHEEGGKINYLNYFK